MAAFIVCIWLGWWYAVLVTVWALVVSRCGMISHAGFAPGRTSAAAGVPFHLRPWVVNLAFPVYALSGLVAIVTLGWLDISYYNSLDSGLTSAVLGTFELATRAGALTSTDLATAEVVVIKQTQAALKSFQDFAWLFKATHVTCFVGTMLVYIVSCRHHSHLPPGPRCPAAGDCLPSHVD